ncbi:hypothetical protein ACS0TY_032810 [Phlomoides rotata]
MKKKMETASDNDDNVRVITKRRRDVLDSSYLKRSRTQKQYDIPMKSRREGKMIVREDESSDQNESDSQVVFKKRQSKRKSIRDKRALHEDDSSSNHDSDMTISLRKRSCRIKEIEPISEEYEKSNHRKDCRGRRKFKSRKNSNSKLQVYNTEYLRAELKNILETSSSDCGTDVQKVTYYEPSNRFGKVDIDKSAAYYRSNMRTALNDLKDLNFKDNHLDELKRTPFWLFFDALYSFDYKALNKRCCKNENDIRQILMAYDEPCESFIVAGHQIIPCSKDVELIFGVHSGSVKIPLKSSDYEIAAWVQRCFGDAIRASNGKCVLYKNVVFEKLKQKLTMEDSRSIKDVGRLTLCYLFTSFFAPNQNGSMAWHLTSYLEKFDKIGVYNWSQFIVDMLMAQIKSSKTLKAGGCAMLLPYWICEHTTLIRPIEDREFPRFLKWDLNQLHDKLCSVKLPNLERRYLTKLVLKPKPFEKEQIGLLVKMWETAVDSTEISGQEDCHLEDELNTAVEVNAAVPIRLFESGRKLEIASTSRVGSSNQLGQKKSPMFKSAQIDGDEKDTPSFSLGVSQIETHTLQANSVINSVLHEITVQYEQLVGDVLMQVSPFVQCAEVENVVDDASVFGRVAESFEIGTQQHENESSSCKTIERLHEEMEQLRREKDLISETYLSELGHRDEAIVQLRQQNIDLNQKLKELVAPTPTQFYENPNNMEMIEQIEELHVTKMKNKELLEENAVLHDSLVKYDKEDHLCETGPVEEKTPTLNKRKKTHGSPSTMIRRVKQRTVNEKRVPKDITPQISTLEIIKLNEGENEDDDDDKPLIQLRQKRKAQEMRWDTRLVGVRRIKEYIKELIQERWYEGGAGIEAWSGKEPMALVTMGNVLSILHHERISSNNLIADHQSGGDPNLRLFVDMRLEDTIDLDWLLFPLNTIVGKKSSGSMGDHWTILKLNIRKGEWHFFNSMIPRKKDGPDVQLNNALMLVEYVTTRLCDVFHRKRPHHPFLKNISSNVVANDCLQQVADSVDCGVIVCFHIEHTIMEKKARKGEFSHISSGNYRAKMVEWFMDPLNVEV